MSPSDFGQILKPFVFLDLFDHEGTPFNAGLHPHSVSPADLHRGRRGQLYRPGQRQGHSCGRWHRMDAGWTRHVARRRARQGRRTRGFQLWIALPPELELGPTVSIYQAPADVAKDGPARVLLGSYGSASSAIVFPSRSLSRGAPEGRRALALRASGGSHRLWTAVASGPCRFPTSCAPATWRLSSRRATRSSSRRGRTLNSFSARPSRTRTISSSARTRSTQRPPRCARLRRTSRGFGRASFKKAACDAELSTIAVVSALTACPIPIRITRMALAVVLLSGRVGERANGCAGRFQ